MKLIVYQVGQSGGIPILNWLVENLMGKKIQILPTDELMETTDFGFYRNLLDFKTNKKHSIYYQPDCLVSDKNENTNQNTNQNDDYQRLIILRDPLNLKLQGDFDQNIWINHAKAAEKCLTNQQPKTFFIIFNTWMVDRRYRDFLCKYLEIENAHDSVDTIPQEVRDKFLLGYRKSPSTQIDPAIKSYLTLFFPLIKLESPVQDKSNQKIDLTKLIDVTTDQPEPKQAKPELKQADQPKSEQPKVEQQKVDLKEKKVKFSPELTKSTPVAGVSVVESQNADGFLIKKVIVSNYKKPNKSLGISGIVLNEEKIILDCLQSIGDYLDYWVINDTGSTDRTPEMILDFFIQKKIPGELHFVPWKNFSYNRNVALEVAKTKSDFCILMDADFIAHIKDTDFKKKLQTPGYLIRYEGGLDYRQILLINCKNDWKYYGVTHEYIDVKPNQVPVEITEFFTFEHTGKGSNREDKFERDVKLLLEGIKDEPDNARYYFYLAQSYKDWQQFDQAIKYYEKRISFGKWDEEVFYSHYQIGLCKKRRGDDFYSYVGNFLNAFMGRRHRIEPLYQILEDCAYEKDRAEFALELGLMAEHTPYPTYDLLFIEKPLYLWLFLDILATCAFTAGKYLVAHRLTQRLIAENRSNQTERFKTNLVQIERLIDQSNMIDIDFKPFQFQRFNLNNSTERIAVIIVNYNLTERTNNLVRYLKRTESHLPLDLIVVDNGSDLIQPSMYTTIRLEENLEDGLGLIHGLKFAESLSLREGFEYHGYLFLTTSVEILSNSNPNSNPTPNQPSDTETKETTKKQTIKQTTQSIKQNTGIIGQMVEFLDRNESFAGVSPSLTVDSLTQWAQMINLGAGGIGGIDGYQLVDQVGKVTNLLDLSCTLFRGTWFRSHAISAILNSKLQSGYGMDMELSYLARKSDQDFAILQNLYLRKISEVGSRIGRIPQNNSTTKNNSTNNQSNNDLTNERIRTRNMEMIKVLNSKYSRVDGPVGSEELNQGPRGAIDLDQTSMDFFQTAFQKLMRPEKIRSDYYQENVEALITIILNFEKSEGAHKLLMEAIYFRFLAYQKVTSPILLEIGGCQNTSYIHLDSTSKLCRLAQVYGYHFVSIDQDQNVTNLNKQRLSSLTNGYQGFSKEMITSSAKEFLTEFKNDNLFFVYIDLDNLDQTKQTISLITPLIAYGGMICVSLGEDEHQQVLQNGEHWTGIWTMVAQSSNGFVFQKMPPDWNPPQTKQPSQQIFQGGELLTKKEFNLK